MPYEIRIPRLGWSTEEGIFVRWCKQPGEYVTVGEPLFEFEGDKALQEIESVDEGLLHVAEDSPQPGSVVPVGTLLGYLLAPGEPLPSAKRSPGMAATQQAVQPQAAAASAHAPAASPIASPRAKRIAVENGIDWTGLQGSGASGRIREADVRAAVGADQNRSQSSPHVLAGSAAATMALSPRRKAIADQLRRSRERTIPVTLTTTADATNLVALREQFKSAHARIVPAYTDIVACLVGAVLKRHRPMASRWDNEHKSLLVPTNDQFDIGIAVDTPGGLVVPVVRDVCQKSLWSVSQESSLLVDRARLGRLTDAEMEGGVFTISNLGRFGIDAFTPIINFPQIAILGLGAIRRDAVVLSDDRVVPRDRIVLSLTFDHAAVDGAPAAAFLRDVSTTIENPVAHLLGG